MEIAVGLMPLREALEFKGPGSKEFEVGLDLFREVPLILRQFLEGFASLAERFGLLDRKLPAFESQSLGPVGRRSFDAYLIASKLDVIVEPFLTLGDLVLGWSMDNPAARVLGSPQGLQAYREAWYPVEQRDRLVAECLAVVTHIAQGSQFGAIGDRPRLDFALLGKFRARGSQFGGLVGASPLGTYEKR